MHRFHALLIPLALATTGLALAPPAAADPVGDCSAMCVEDCFLYVGTGYATGGCSVGHQPYTFVTACFFFGGCGEPVVYCYAFEYDRDPNCDVYHLDPVEPGCTQLFVGPDIDSGVCHDLGSKGCKVWTYDTYGTMGGSRCLVATPST